MPQTITVVLALICFGAATARHTNSDADVIAGELADAIETIDRLYNDTEATLARRIDTVDPLQQANRQLAEYTRSDATARERAFGALTAEILTKKLRRRNLLGALDGDDPSASRALDKLRDVCATDGAHALDDCTTNGYRRADGRCNNVRRPDRGAKYAAFQRLLPPDYADDVGEPRRYSVQRESARGAPPTALPNVRLLSNLLFREPNAPLARVSAFAAHWAMFVFADLAHIGSAQLQLRDNHTAALPCCPTDGSAARHPECMPIALERDDPAYRGFVDCMTYARTRTAPRADGATPCALGAREQANMATAFLDASPLYGSDEAAARRLRAGRGGQLRSAANSDGDALRPPVPCPNFVVGGLGLICSSAGSDRVGFLPTLAAIHALFARQHNRVARQFQEMNPRWTDEQLYQEARRVVVAQIQHITYEEFLPLAVGREAWRRHGLDGAPAGSGGAGDMARSGTAFVSADSYQLDVDPSTLNVYAAAVGQFFFTMFDSRLAQIGADGTRSMDRPLSEYINEPSALLFNDKMEGFLRYLLRQSAHRPGLRMTTELRDRLFKRNANLGLDLAALILQTGRDHGLPGYTSWRRKCGGSEIHSIDELAEEVEEPDRILPILSRHYRHVDDIDVFIGGLAERPIRGAILGPTFACILATQFEKTKRGDRYWYENRLGPWVFSDVQLTEIRKTTLAHVLCANANLEGVQPLALLTPDELDNYPLACNSTMLAAPDLSAWRDAEPQAQAPVSAAAVERAMRVGMSAYMADQKRERRNIAKNQGDFEAHDPLLAYGKMMRPKPEAIEISRMAHVLLETTKELMTNDPNLQQNDANLQRLPKMDMSAFIGNIEPFLGDNGTLEKCLPKDLPCDHTSPYRTYNGWCNNLRFPHYGNAFGPLRRLLTPAYEDGIDAPRSQARSGRPLPSARLISNAVHVDEPIFHSTYTHMVMQFGQILDHELTHSPVERGPDDQILNCSRCDSHKTLSEHCMPLPVPEGDPFFPTHDAHGERRCFAFARSLLGQVSLGYRNQLNQLTAFIDGSAIYGSTQCEAVTLRSFVGGRLNFTVLGDYNTEALPQGDQEQDCRSTPRFPCFVAGDERNSHQPGLTTIHNIFLREHNRIARQLERINPAWDDERTYQETRKIVGALFQHVAYREFVPKLIGGEMAARFGLRPEAGGAYFAGYDPHCDASISHPFATAAFRFGHTLIRRMFPRMNTFYRNFTEPIDLVKSFNNVEAVYDRHAGGIDTILVGLLGSKCMAFDRFITTAVRNHLFEIRDVPLSGMDLITLNILRARDHGVQPYNRYREFCGLKRAHSFEDLGDHMDPSSIEALRGVYEHVDDIDLFPGLVSERPLPGALLAPTMSCIIAEQFQRLKKCDRFYYENDIAETRFSPEQLAEIRKISLGSILCQNSKLLTKIQPDVFSIPDDLGNAQIPCEDFPRMNLLAWMERPSCQIGNDRVPRGASKLKSPCVKCTCTSDGPRCKAIKILNCDNLLNNFLMTDVKEDLSCVIQCAVQINRRIGAQPL